MKTENMVKVAIKNRTCIMCPNKIPPESNNTEFCPRCFASLKGTPIRDEKYQQNIEVISMNTPIRIKTEEEKERERLINEKRITQQINKKKPKNLLIFK